MKPIKELLKKFKIHPNDIDLYECAFTHPSCNADAKTKHRDYERLEFLGDSVLGCIVAELAYRSHPEMEQGPLTKLKSALVQSKALADFSREYHFQDYIRVGSSYVNDIAKADSLLEDVFESFIGALFIDQGFKATRKVLIDTLYNDIQRFREDFSTDYKSRLQEEMQAEHKESVTYKLVSATGPAHNRRFVVQVRFGKFCLGKGEGSTKKAAEQLAAKDALSKKVA